MNYPNKLEEKIGFDHVREALVGIADTEVGKEIASVFPFLNKKDKLESILAETQEFVDILSFEKGFDWSAPNDLRQALQTASIPGTYLSEETFLDIRNNYRAIKKILSFFSAVKPELYPVLRQRISIIKVFSFILDRVDQVFNKQGHIKDNASKELSHIRISITQKSNGISKRIKKILDQAQNEGYVDQDASPTLRDGRLVIPVPASNKRRINGLIHDESSTGKTVFIEPVELIEVNNEIRELEISEKREIVKILMNLTESIRPYFDDILTWPALIGELDFIRAKAKLCIQWNGRNIALTSDHELDLKKVRHPLLVLAFKAEGKKVVPQDIKLDEENRILLISGPNAGGKSVCLKTIGLVQYMVQCGLLPPVDEGSVTPVFGEMFIDIGDDQSLENDLSTYSSHLINMKYFIKNAGPGSLVLIDEFGTGTEPQLGAALAQAILGDINATGAYGVITTHYSNLKHFAASEDGIINGAMLYDAQNMQPRFELEIGKPGSSFAFEIAQKIGLPDSVLQKAKDQVGPDYIKFDKHLREIARDKRYWENKRKKIRKSEKDLELLLDQYNDLIKNFEKKKKQQLKDTQKEADLLLTQINKQIENTIQKIRRTQADKEKTKEARKEIHDFSERTRKSLKGEEDNLSKEIGELKQKESSIRKKISHSEDGRNKVKIVVKTKEESEYSIFVPGLKVKLKDRDTVGEVLKVNKNSVLISIGQMMTTISPDQLEIINDKEFDRSGGNIGGRKRSNSYHEIETRRMHFSPNLDVRGVRADEAIQKVQALVDEAIMLGENNLRILHGKGNGVLREVLRQYLTSTDIVKSCTDEDIRFGGTGITLVVLDY